MKYLKLFNSVSIACVIVALLATDLLAQDLEIPVNREGGVKPVPISITGYSGEVASVLRFDLEVMGFKSVGPEEAQYILSGSNNGDVKGQLSDRISKAVLFSKVYSGASIRAQAHRLADDVVLK